jgi:hypothetical protein
MARAGFHSVCRNRNKSLANRSQVYCGLLRSALRQQGLYAASPGLWQSALKVRLLAAAIRGVAIFLVAISGDLTVDCHDPWYTFEHGVGPKSEIQPQQFYFESPLFAAPFLFAHDFAK